MRAAAGGARWPRGGRERRPNARRRGDALSAADAPAATRPRAASIGCEQRVAWMPSPPGVRQGSDVKGPGLSPGRMVGNGNYGKRRGADTAAGRESFFREAERGTGDGRSHGGLSIGHESPALGHALGGGGQAFIHGRRRVGRVCIEPRTDHRGRGSHILGDALRTLIYSSGATRSPRGGAVAAAAATRARRRSSASTAARGSASPARHQSQSSTSAVCWRVASSVNLRHRHMNRSRSAESETRCMRHLG